MNNLEPYFRKKGISPVIGVILLVALVVALITLATVVVFNIGDESAQEAADTAIDITQTSSGIQARVISNNNVDEYQINFPDGTQQTLDGDVGSSLNLVGPEGLYTVVAVLEDGSEQTILTQDISGLDYSGVFIVEQDEDDGEVEAVLAQEFDNIDDYDLNLETNEDGDTTTELQSLDFESQSSLLADELLNEQLGSENTARAEILELISIQSEPGENAIGIGERIAVHEMVNLCKGDELQLEDSDDGDVLASETILVDNDCNVLRKVAQYENGEITAVELFNLWNQELDYFVFQYDGQPQPELPSMPAPTTDDGLTLEAYVHEEDDFDEEIPGATVVIGDMTEQTDSDGYAVFENIDAGEDLQSTDINEIDATAYRDGYKPAGVRTIPPENEGWDSEEPHEENFELEPIEEFDEPSYVEDDPISPGGESRTLDIGSSSGGGGGMVIGGGGGGGGGSTASLGGFYSGGASTSTFSESVPTVTETVQPERLFNVIEIDESLIPTGGEFRVDTTVRATGEEDLTDDINIYMSPTNEDQVQLMLISTCHQLM